MDFISCIYYPVSLQSTLVPTANTVHRWRLWLGSDFCGNVWTRTVTLTGFYAVVFRRKMTPAGCVTLIQSWSPSGPSLDFWKTSFSPKAWSECLLCSSWSSRCSSYLQYISWASILENASLLSLARRTSSWTFQLSWLLRNVKGAQVNLHRGWRVV